MIDCGETRVPDVTPRYDRYVKETAAYVTYGHYSWPSYSVWLVPGSYQED